MDVEELLVACIANGSVPFHHAVDAFVSQLLHEVGYSPRPTDGVLFGREAIEAGRAIGVGFVVMIDTQLFQPLHVEFVLDAARRGLASGFVHFGSRDPRDVPHSDTAHLKLLMRMLTAEKIEFPWIERFSRDADRWHHELDE